MRHVWQRRQARRALAWGLAVFVAMQLGTTLLLERWLPVLRDPHFVHKASRLERRLREAPVRPKLVVVFGTSRVSEALRGTAVEEDLGRRLGQPVVVYNLGIPGDCPFNELLNLERLLAAGVRPDLAVVEVFPFYLRDNCADALPLLPAERMGLHDRAVLAGYGLPVGALTRWSWRCAAVPWYAHRLEILTALVPGILPTVSRQDLYHNCGPDGYKPLVADYRALDREQLRQANRAWYGSKLRPYHVGGPFCPALSGFLTRCHAEGIPAALLLMPEGPAFRGFYPPAAWPQVLAYVRGLGRDGGAAVLDARDWFPEEDFLDSHHLTPPAALRFTRRLADEALLPLLRGSTVAPSTFRLSAGKWE